MKFNLHTHTPRCRHATGTEREYIETAIRTGLQLLGFSDHAPMPFSGGYYSTMRMFPQQLEDYVTTLLQLKEEYRAQIEIRIGFEAEYYPGLWEDFLRLIDPYPIDYLILGQHFLHDEIGSQYVALETHRDQDLIDYVAQCCAGMQTGRFTYLAHPDVLNYQGSAQLYEAQMTQLCRCALQLGIPLELNIHGTREQRGYPKAQFWRIAGQVGNTAVLGFDAHSPQGLDCPEAVSQCRALAAQYHIPILENIPLKKPF